MKYKSKVVCFVDDDPMEVKAFEKVFGGDFTVIADTTPKAVLDKLRERKLKSNLFILDLYFADGRGPSESERHEAIRLKEEVDRAQKKLVDFLGTIGQSRRGGLDIMRHLRKTYSTTPIVFFTRKGTLDDAIACFDAGADGVFPKAAPRHFDPKGDRLEQFVQAAREHHPSLSTKFFYNTSTSNVFKKIGRIIKFVWGNWLKL